MGICKRISAEKKSVSAAGRTRNLANYITNPQLENGLEKCVWSGAKNFLSNTHEGRIAEMISLAGESKHSKDPLDHWMISLHDDEKFSQEQAEQAVDIFLQHTGLEGHQVIWGVHDDTKNRHIHISVNRVNPETLLVTKINKGFNKEAGQQVIALIEHKQGWKSERGARYAVTDGVPVMTAEAAKTKAQRMAGSNEPKKPNQKAQDMEQQTGTKSAQRVGSEDAAPIIAAARTWRELHDNLAVIGMRYERKGSGAIIYVGEVVVKASDVSRAASLSALQKRFGAYQPAKEIKPNEYHHHTAGRNNKATQSHFVALGKEPTNSMRDLSECHLVSLESGKQNKSVLSIDARPGERRAGGLRRGSGLRRSTNNNGTNRTNQGIRSTSSDQGSETGEPNRLHIKPMEKGQPGWSEYQTIKAEHKAAKDGATTNLKTSQQVQRDALFEKQKAERSELFTRSWRGQGTLRNAMLSIIATRHAAEKLELREQQQAERKAVREQFHPLPQYKTWKEQPQIVSHAEQIEVKPVQQPQLAALLRTLRQSPDLSGYFTYRFGDVALFRDEGKTIAVLDQSSRSIAAALAVAQSKYGQTLTLTGSHDFQVRAVRAAVEHGLTVKFKDTALEKMRVQMLEEKRQAERNAQRQVQARAEEQASPLPERAAPAPEAQIPFVPPTIPTPLLPAEIWAANQDKPLVEARKNDNRKTEFIVVHLSDQMVVDHGKNVALYPIPIGIAIQVGQRVVINKNGSISTVPDRSLSDTGVGR